MIKIITATNNPELNEEIKKEKNVQVLYKDIFYKEGILEILEKDIEIDYIIIDENLSGEIELNNLIKKIIEKNKNIKIIITIKKENKNKININNKKIIKIYYEGKINLAKIKNNKINNSEKKEINNKNNYKKEKIKNYKNKFKDRKNKFKKNNIKFNYYIKNKIYKIKKINKNFQNKTNQKNINSKIISIFGERQVGKSIFIIRLTYYLKSKGYRILLVELNEENPSFYSIFGYKKFNKKYKENKKILKNEYRKINQKYFPKYVNKKILENMIIKINKNIHLISYNKLLNYDFIEYIKNNYDYIITENYFRKNNLRNKKIINNSEKIILIINPNLLGIKNSKKIIEKNKLNIKNNKKIIDDKKLNTNNYKKNTEENKNNLKIIINYYDKFSIDEEIIRNIFSENKIIGKIKYENSINNLINENFENINYKNLKKDFEKIEEYLTIK